MSSKALFASASFAIGCWMGCVVDLASSSISNSLEKNIPRDPTRRTGISKELEMEDDARSTTHPIQQPIANEAEQTAPLTTSPTAKARRFCSCSRVFWVKMFSARAFVDISPHTNIRIRPRQDLWNALSDASGKPVGEIAAAWTEQPGFPVVKGQTGRRGRFA